MNNVRADFHMHTVASDGTLTPEELMDEIIDEGIEVFSVTDHDSIDSMAKMEELAKRYNKKFIKGVEISSILEGEQFHILAYDFDENNKELLDLIHNNARLLEKKDDDSIKMLIDYGFDLDYDEYLNYEHNSKEGGWKTLNFLKKKGLCTGVEDFFSKIFTGERSLRYPDFPHPKEIIETIKRANGIAILAHPKYGESIFDLDETLRNFKEWGICGIECSHPHHDEETINYLKQYAKENNLIITGGSDYHGGLISKRSLGNPKFYVEDNIFENRM